MNVVEAPQEWHGGDRPTVFLAGGISGCPDWQQNMVKLLSDVPAVLLNPRRADFPTHDPKAAEEQIAWEHRHLHRASVILFWFCAATLNPIALYELGAWSMTSKPIAVGVEPGYAHEQDVRIQTGLVRPDVQVVDNHTDLAGAVMDLMP